MIIGIPKENVEGEKRVALVPESIPKLKGFSIVVEKDAGERAGFLDSTYVEKGASITPDSATLYGEADIVTQGSASEAL